MTNRVCRWWRYWFGPLDLAKPWTRPPLFLHVVLRIDARAFKKAIAEAQRGIKRLETTMK